MKFWRERKRERERKMAKYLASKLVGTRGFYKQTSLVKEMYLRLVISQCSKNVLMCY
jgi:hypothetical protein